FLNFVVPSAQMYAAESTPGATAAATDPAAATNSRQDFVRSLSLRADRIIADSSHPTMLWLSQTSPVAYRPAAATKLKLSLAPAAANTSPIKELGTFEVPPRDLAQRPFAAAAEMDGVADGNYRIVATVRH